MACLSAETATLTFAIINIVLVSLSAASSLGTLIFWAVQVFAFENSMDQYQLAVTIRALASIISWITFSLLGLVFASFLLNGSIKKNPAHIKAYFVYGVVKMVFTVLAMALMCAILEFSVEWHFIICVLVGFVVYGSILHMLRHTYKKMELENNQFNHKPLDEKI